MLKFLYNWFGWVPVIGPWIKGAYIASLVGKIVSVANGWVPDDGVRQHSGAELDNALADEANDLISKVIEPLELGLLADIVRRMAVDKVVAVMRAKIIA